MAQSEEELIAASEAATEGSENRLTEVLATVLDAHHPLSAELFACRGLDAGARVRYFTQEWLAPGCQPDMVARSEDQHRGPVAELWFEHKKDSGFRPGQLEDYRDALASRAGRNGPGSNGLIALVVDEDEASDWTVLTWQTLAEKADRLGREWEGPSWREHALKPEAPAMWRLLHELLAYLEKEGLAVLKALDQRNVDVFRALPDTWDRLEALVTRAAGVTGLTPLGELGLWLHDDGSALWQLFEPAPNSWLVTRIDQEEHDCWAELSLWAEEPLDEPAVVAGYTLPSTLYHTLHAHGDLAARANKVGLEIREWDDHARIVRIKTLAEFVEGSDSLDEQVGRVAAFAREAIAAAEDLDPGELRMPHTRTRDARS